MAVVDLHLASAFRRERVFARSLACPCGAGDGRGGGRHRAPPGCSPSTRSSPPTGCAIPVVQYLPMLGLKLLGETLVKLRERAGEGRGARVCLTMVDRREADHRRGGGVAAQALRRVLVFDTVIRPTPSTRPPRRTARPSSSTSPRGPRARGLRGLSREVMTRAASPAVKKGFRRGAEAVAPPPGAGCTLPRHDGICEHPRARRACSSTRFRRAAPGAHLRASPATTTAGTTSPRGRRPRRRGAARGAPGSTRLPPQNDRWDRLAVRSCATRSTSTSRPSSTATTASTSTTSRRTSDGSYDLRRDGHLHRRGLGTRSPRLRWARCSRLPPTRRSAWARPSPPASARAAVAQGASTRATGRYRAPGGLREVAGGALAAPRAGRRGRRARGLQTLSDWLEGSFTSLRAREEDGVGRARYLREMRRQLGATPDRRRRTPGAGPRWPASARRCSRSPRLSRPALARGGADAACDRPARTAPDRASFAAMRAPGAGARQLDGSTSTCPRRSAAWRCASATGRPLGRTTRPRRRTSRAQDGLVPPARRRRALSRLRR